MQRAAYQDFEHSCLAEDMISKLKRFIDFTTFFTNWLALFSSIWITAIHISLTNNLAGSASTIECPTS